MGEAAPWAITVLVSIAAAVVTVLTATTSIFDSRSRHGLVGGRLTIGATRFDLAAGAVEFEVVNAGANAVFGVAGRLDFLTGEGAVRFDVAGVDRIGPGQRVVFRGRGLKPQKRWKAWSRENRDLLKLRLTYFDHADARRIENRWFRRTEGGELIRFRVRRAYTSFG